MADIADKFWQAPPVTRTIVAAMFVESALVLSGMLQYQYVMFYTPWVFFKFPPQFWRLVTSFLLTGPGISFFFDLFFMWTYGNSIEINSPRFTEPGSFFVFVCFSAVIIVLVAGIALGAFIFTAALELAFMYTFALDNRGRKVGFIIFQIPAELLPWATLTLTFVTAGPTATLHQGTGLLAAHLYDFLTRLYPTFQGGTNYIKTPVAIRRFFGGDQARSTQRAYGTSFRPATDQQQSQPLPRGWTSGFSRGWNGNGAGRRLGGD